jgi:hypothetical protein
LLVVSRRERASQYRAEAEFRRQERWFRSSGASAVTAVLSELRPPHCVLVILEDESGLLGWRGLLEKVGLAHPTTTVRLLADILAVAQDEELVEASRGKPRFRRSFPYAHTPTRFLAGRSQSQT